MVAVSQDQRWPFIGDTVALEASGLVGDRADFRLVSKPPLSALELYDAGKKNYLQGSGDRRATLAPDADGTYVIGVDDVAVTVNAKHFSNDGGVGVSKGVETESTSATTTHTVYVGRQIERKIGFGEGELTVRAYCHSQSGTPSSGVLTYYAGAGYAPRIVLSGVTSDRALIAARATSVVAAVASMGGTGYTGSAHIISWDDVYDDHPLIKIGRTLQRFSDHIDTVAMPVHETQDASGSTEVTAATATSRLSLIALLNDHALKYDAHCKNTTAHYELTDTVNTASTLAPLSNLVATAACVARHISLRGLYESHLALIYPSVDSTSMVHKAPGGLYDALTVRVATGAAVTAACSAANNFTTKYMLHRERSVAAPIDAAGYHNSTTGQLGLQPGGRPTTLARYPATVTKLLDLLDKHATNKTIDGSAATYHASKDYGASTSDIPRPDDNDVAMAIRCHEILDARLSAHVVRAAPTHDATGAANAGGWVATMGGIAGVHEAYSTAFKSSGATVPANENVAAAKLVMLGGWAKV